MRIMRKYKNLGWWDFIEYMEEKLAEHPEKELYFEFLDEIRLRFLESVSEGASFKYQNKAQELVELLKLNSSEDTVKLSEQDLVDFQRIASEIVK